MGIRIQWDNPEKTIIRWEFEGRWTSEQFQEALKFATTLAQEVNHTVYGLGIMHGRVSANVLMIGQRVFNRWPANMGQFVFVGASGLLESTFSILRKVDKDAPQVIFVNSHAEAYEIITQLHLKEVYAKS